MATEMEAAATSWLNGVGAQFDEALARLLLDLNFAVPGPTEPFTLRLLQPNEAMVAASSSPLAPNPKTVYCYAETGLTAILRHLPSCGFRRRDHPARRCRLAPCRLVP